MAVLATVRAEAERSPWRWPAAAVALAVAMAHVPVTAEHLSEAPYIGWSFVVLEIASVVLAVALVLRDDPLVWWAAVVVPVLAIDAYLLTRSVDMPQIADDLGNWTEPLGVVSLAAEGLLAVIAAGHDRPSMRGSGLVGRPLLTAGVLLTVGALVVVRLTLVGG